MGKTAITRYECDMCGDRQDEKSINGHILHTISEPEPMEILTIKGLDFYLCKKCIEKIQTFIVVNGSKDD